MKIIYISHWRFPSEKTMSPLIMKTCEMFAKSGIEVELWVPRRRNPQFRGVDPFMYHGIERNFIIRRISVLDLMGTLPGSFFFLLMLITFQISSFFLFLLKLNFNKNILYFHDARDALLFLFLRRLRFLEIHDFYRSGVGWINRLVFPRVTGFIVTNRFKMNILKSNFNIPEERMLHQPNAADVKMFSPNISREAARKRLGLPLDKKIILYTGHLFYWKGVDTLLEAEKYLAWNELVYFVGGTDEDIKEFKVKSEKHAPYQTEGFGAGLKVENVVIAGRKPHREIPFWQKAADVLVLPNSGKFGESKYETSPVKLFEYMASGTPIVASDLPSIRNIVDDTMVWFFEADNPQALADAIRRTLGNENESKKRAQAARQEVEKYSWKRRTENITKFLLYLTGLSTTGGRSLQV